MSYPIRTKSLPLAGAARLCLTFHILFAVVIHASCTIMVGKEAVIVLGILFTFPMVTAALIGRRGTKFDPLHLPDKREKGYRNIAIFLFIGQIAVYLFLTLLLFGSGMNGDPWVPPWGFLFTAIPTTLAIVNAALLVQLGKARKLDSPLVQLNDPSRHRALQQTGLEEHGIGGGWDQADRGSSSPRDPIRNAVQPVERQSNSRPKPRAVEPAAPSQGFRPPTFGEKRDSDPDSSQLPPNATDR